MPMIIRYLPNVLSVFRLIIALTFPLAPEKYWIWLIIGGGGSDFLDGWIARRWNVTSWAGRVLDAIADKLFVLSVLLTFVLSGKIVLWVVPAVVARDLMVVMIAAYTQYYQAWDSFRRIKSRWSGKIATAGQFLLLVAVALSPEFIRPALVVSILLSIAAAGDYGRQFLVALRQRAGA
ncbi:MAG: CDP-alcohol phosphatidyltransferase family protein [Desulfobulbaceae bacterium]|nr:CDP-alcohol phosphatidyltransferase family protein [Desulfobulbaceae bacterium]